MSFVKFINILILLTTVKFTWKAPDPGDQVTKVEVHVTTVKGDYSNAQIYDAGLPAPDAQGNQSFTTTLDTSVPLWAVIRGRNSFGLSDPGAELRVGKPQSLKNSAASPG